MAQPSCRSLLFLRQGLDVLVYLVNDTVVQLTVDNLHSVTAHELHRIIRETLMLPEYAMEVFSLWLISPLLGEALRSLGGRGGLFSASVSTSVLPTCGADRRHNLVAEHLPWMQKAPQSIAGPE